MHLQEYLQQDLKRIGVPLPPILLIVFFVRVIDKPLQLHWFAFTQSQHLQQPSNFKPLLQITLNHYRILLATIACNNKARCRLGNLTPRLVPIFQIGKLIMAVKPAKATTAPDLVAQSAAPLITDIDLESAIADQLLDDIDWQKVRAAIIRKAPAKLFAWFQSQILPIDGQPIITNEIEAMAIYEGDSNA